MLKIINIKINLVEKVLLVTLLLALFFTGILPQEILSVIIIFISIIFLYLNKPQFIFPVMLFYYSQLGLLFGISVFRIFTILFVLFLIINNWKRLKFDKVYLSIIIVYGLYCLLSLGVHDFQLGIFALFDVLCLLLFVNNYLYDFKKIKEFFLQFVLVSIVAVFTGLITNNFLDTQMVEIRETITYLRFMSTFDDPNYMGFFYTIAVFAVVCLKLFKGVTKYIILVFLYAAIITSLSVTAIIGNLVFWVLYLLLKSKLKLKTTIGILSIIIFCFIIIFLGVNFDVPFLSQLLTRIKYKLLNLNAGDIDGFTTYRTSLSELHFNYFLNQNLFKQLFGGNLVNALIIDLPLLQNSAAHNEYIDLLLNVGIIGTICLVTFQFTKLFHHFKKYRETKDDGQLFLVIVKCIWLFYAASLTLFLDVRFIIFFLM